MPKVFAGMVASVNEVPPALPLPGGEIGWPAVFLVQLINTQETFRLPADATPYQRWAVQKAFRSRRPLYLLVDDGVVRDARLPLVGRVARFENVDGISRVALDSSSQALSVPQHNEQARLALTAAGIGGAIMMVTTGNRGEIIDAQLAPLEATYLAPTFNQIGLQPVTKIKVSVRSLADVEDLFIELREGRCGVEAADTCIPFEYPESGCEARAEEMCNRLRALTPPVTAGKVWVFPPMETRSPNSELCPLSWGFHVAPYLLVNEGTKTTPKYAVYVLDPSLFGGPMRLSAFAKALSIKPSDVRFSSRLVYQASPTGPGSKADAGQVEDMLDICRRNAADRDPQPPYACP